MLWHVMGHRTSPTNAITENETTEEDESSSMMTTQTTDIVHDKTLGNQLQNQRESDLWFVQCNCVGVDDRIIGGLFDLKGESLCHGTEHVASFWVASSEHFSCCRRFKQDSCLYAQTDQEISTIHKRRCLNVWAGLTYRSCFGLACCVQFRDGCYEKKAQNGEDRISAIYWWWCQSAQIWHDTRKIVTTVVSESLSVNLDSAMLCDSAMSV